MDIGLEGVPEPLVITHNGGDLGCNFVISATPTKAKLRRFDNTNTGKKYFYSSNGAREILLLNFLNLFNKSLEIIILLKAEESKPKYS